MTYLVEWHIGVLILINYHPGGHNAVSRRPFAVAGMSKKRLGYPNLEIPAQSRKANE
jgi:hypothetical protein